MTHDMCIYSSTAILCSSDMQTREIYKEALSFEKCMLPTCRVSRSCRTPSILTARSYQKACWTRSPAAPPPSCRPKSWVQSLSHVPGHGSFVDRAALMSSDYTRLDYTIPYCTILYYTILYHTIPYYTIPYHTILYCTILYHTVPYHTLLYPTLLYPTIP